MKLSKRRRIRLRRHVPIVYFTRLKEPVNIDPTRFAVIGMPFFFACEYAIHQRRATLIQLLIDSRITFQLVQHRQLYSHSQRIPLKVSLPDTPALAVQSYPSIRRGHHKPHRQPAANNFAQRRQVRFDLVKLPPAKAHTKTSHDFIKKSAPCHAAA